MRSGAGKGFELGPGDPGTGCKGGSGPGRSCCDRDLKRTWDETWWRENNSAGLGSSLGFGCKVCNLAREAKKRNSLFFVLRKKRKEKL